MSLLKRFELWVLLILIGGGLFYVFNIQDASDEYGRAPITATDSDSSDEPEPPPRFSLRKTTITRDGDNFLAEIDLFWRIDRTQTPKLNSPGTRLLAAGDREIPTFFLPFQAPVQVPESGEVAITLRYWLSRDDIAGPLSLHIEKDIISVKTGEFDAEELPEKQSRSFTDNDWSTKA